ncbi:ABC transporter substrate-binding protein [Pasteurellaceae bacterium LIM206]|nr:ABC transporter substrate-binding protein [Pasteurellaceae bacterium LIM206]
MKKLIALFVAAAAIVVWQWNDKDAVTVNTDEPLVVVTPWEITSTDPSKSGYIFQRLQLAETLVDADEEGRLQPALAERWVPNERFDQWLFYLRPDVKFHDGSLLRAEDVVFSLRQALIKPTPLKNAHIRDIQALDEHTVRISLAQPLVSFPAFLTHSTTLILARSAFDEQGNVVKFIATGAYQADKIEPPQKIEQHAFADYWGEKANIRRVNYLANSRSETRTLLAQSNMNYLVFNLDPASLSRLKADSDLNVQSKSIARTIQYKVNAAHPLFADVKVRRILSDAIDREGLVHAVLRMDHGEAETLLPESFSDWYLKVASVKPQYSELKKGLIALGYEDKDGMLYKDGKPFKFVLRTFSDRPELPVIATALQNQWKQLGIDVVVSIGNFSEIPAGHQDGSLEMALYARHYGMVPDPIGVLLQDFVPQGSDWGVMNWSNQELTEALSQLQHTAEPERQYALKQKITGIIYAERPITPVIFYQQNAVAHKALKGLRLDPFERNFHLNKLSW